MKKRKKRYGLRITEQEVRNTERLSLD